MIGFWQQVRVLAGHELRVERRAQETAGLVIPFALAALVTIPLAIGLDQPAIARFGYPAFWAVSLLFGMQVAWRQAASTQLAVSDQIRLAGVDPAAGFTARVVANFLLVGAFLVITFAAMVFFYSPPPVDHGWLLVLALVLYGVGISLLATLMADLTVGWATRSGLAPLLAAPVLLPLLFAASQVTETLTRPSGLDSSGGILAWLLVLVLIVLISAIAGVLTARSLEETIG